MYDMMIYEIDVTQQFLPLYDIRNILSFVVQGIHRNSLSVISAYDTRFRLYGGGTRLSSKNRFMCGVIKCEGSAVLL